MLCIQPTQRIDGFLESLVNMHSGGVPTAAAAAVDIYTQIYTAER